MGWIDHPVARALLEDQYAPIAEYLAGMAQVAHEAREFVMMGRRSVETDLPPVLSSVWAHPTRDVAAVALTNWTRKTCAGTLDLTESDLPGTPSALEPVEDAGLPPIELTDDGELRLSVPQLSTVFVELA